MESTRLLYNKAILAKLQRLIEEHPEQRFTQLLWNVGIFRTESEDANSRIVDTYNEESEITWKNMVNNSFCFLPNKTEDI